MKTERRLMLLCVSLFLLFQLSFSNFLQAQEVLLPLQTGPVAAPAVKGATEPVALPFFDDFSSQQSAVSSQRWQARGGVTVGRGGGLLPPTVGVATLDAIGADGSLYANASLGRFVADTLCSRSIALDSLTVADSVVLSFYYLPGGGKGDLWRRIGDAPDPEDSLMLDFYRRSDSTWVMVWACGGITVDSLLARTGRDWQYVAISLTDTAFFNDDFAFRFRNYCSVVSSTKPGMVGNCDFWHLDYFLLDRGRSTVGNPIFHDVAFVEPAPSMLKVYQSMPARQYRQSDMADSLSMTITNLFSSPLATQYKYAILDVTGDTLSSYDGGYENAPPFLPGGRYQESQAHARPVVQYAFAESDVATEYLVVHTVHEGVDDDDFPWSDTVKFRQVFDNYYAYDDGTAENGYGLTSTSSRVYLAYRFDLNTEDTLTAVDLYFNRTLSGDNESVPFNITIWRNDDGKPGAVLYRDETSRHPAFAGLDVYSRYMLEHSVVVEGSIFVGFEQGNNYFINLGFDRNHDISDRIYYLTGTAWQQSILSGALMIRPCFGVSATVGIAEAADSKRTIELYPNPADEWVRVEGLPEGSEIVLYDMMGRRILSTREKRISTTALADGVYMVRCGSQVKKLIIKH